MINPKKLLALRKDANLSAEALAEQAGVGRATITRIENGKTKNSNATTVNRLAEALKCKPNDLATPPESRKIDSFLEERMPTNVKLSSAAQNALYLVSARYGESREAILELAPLLFDLVARESLKVRRVRLTELQDQRADFAEKQSNFPHLGARLTNDWAAEEMENLEECSIGKGDLRGRLVHADPDFDDSYYPSDYDDECDNPFVIHLRNRFDNLTGDGGETPNIDTWPRWRSPSYELGLSEARQTAGGDSDLAEAIVEGVIMIDAIPNDLRKANRMEERQAWMQERLAEHSERMSKLLASLNIDLTDIGGEGS